MTVLKRDSQYHTYGDYLIWSRDFGDELIDGTAYVREPPSPGVPHQLVVSELFHQIANALEGTHWRVIVAPLDIRLPKSTELDSLVDTVVQPDIFITGNPSKLDKRGMRGAPDWLVEVLSSSTAQYDRKVKIPIYERAGVREVWLVDPRSLQVTIHRLENGHYWRPTVVEMKGQTELTAVPGVIINWDRLVARCL
jgi:Uma2 family endonuclease